MEGTIIQVSLSKGGMPKLPVGEASVSVQGLTGDDHRNKKVHGGPRKAVLLVSIEDLDQLKQEGYPLFPGALGENLTIRDLDFRALRPGMRFRAGSAVLELTQLRTPCANLDVYNDANGARRIQDDVYDLAAKRGDVSSPHWARAGIYAAVLQDGIIRDGDIIKLLDQAV